MTFNYPRWRVPLSMFLRQFRRAGTMLVLQITCAAARAASAPTTPTEPLLDLGLLYRSDTNRFVQEVWTLGRYHGQYWNTEGSAGADDGYEDRRFRLGGQVRMFNNLTLHAQAISGSDFEPRYNGFTELWAGWRFSDALILTVGQQKHRFTHDRNVSSRYMSFMERSMFTNMMGLDYTPAVTLSGRIDKLEYYAGVFSNSAGTDMWDSFTELDSGSSFLAAVTYDLGHFLGAETASFYGGYLHSEAHANATNLTRFDDALAGALIFTDGPAAFVAELTAGFGGARGDAIGLNLQPSYFLTDTLEVVSRYQIASSSQATGLSSQRRYERLAGLGNGDAYQAVYLGLNHYIAGHRLKLLTGMEYARMNQRDSFMVWAGIRMFFGPHSNAPYPGNKLLKGRW